MTHFITQRLQCPSSFNNRVASLRRGGGLGRSCAWLWPARGAKSSSMIFGRIGRWQGGSETMAAKSTSAEIEGDGRRSMANGANVPRRRVEGWSPRHGGSARSTFSSQMREFCANKSFSKRRWPTGILVCAVHSQGWPVCTKAVWNHMKANQYGPHRMTTSKLRCYGNFGNQLRRGQGRACRLMRTLCLEGISTILHQHGCRRGTLHA